jgi:hypothetical protein
VDQAEIGSVGGNAGKGSGIHAPTGKKEQAVWVALALYPGLLHGLTPALP